MAYVTPSDIGARAAQLCGVHRLRDLNTDTSPQAIELRFAYDKVRLAELERNLWTFATRRVVLRALGIDSVVWTPLDWSASTTYAVGMVVKYAPISSPYSGTSFYWTNTVAKAAVATTPDVDPDWHLYCGPTALDLYDSSVTYNSGEVVITPSLWSAVITYNKNDMVRVGTTWYVSLIDTNLNNSPATSPTDWIVWTTGGRGQGSYGQTATHSPVPLTYPGYAVYRSVYNSNADNPVNATANWVNVGGTVVPLALVWPVSSGPVSEKVTMNAFRLPNGFLKRAPTDPKGGMTAYLGAASGSNPEDWVIEGDYIVTGDAGPIMLRFVANALDVPDMHPMFCEALATSLANEVGSTLIQEKKPVTLAKIERNYRRKINEARAVNAIEVGPVTPVENRYVTVRA